MKSKLSVFAGNKKSLSIRQKEDGRKETQTRSSSVSQPKVVTLESLMTLKLNPFSSFSSVTLLNCPRLITDSASSSYQTIWVVFFLDFGTSKHRKETYPLRLEDEHLASHDRNGGTWLRHGDNPFLFGCLGEWTEVMITITGKRTKKVVPGRSFSPSIHSFRPSIPPQLRWLTRRIEFS